MKLSTIILVVAGAGVAYFAYKRYRAGKASSSPTAADVLVGSPVAGGPLDPTAWGRG